MKMKKKIQLNKKNKNGSWTLSGEYLTYKKEGGELNPAQWNEASKRKL